MSTLMVSDWQRTRPPLKRVTSPAAPGNDLAMKHGATSPRVIQPIADRLAAELLEERPWLRQHERTVRSWARVQAQYDTYIAWFDQVGFFDDDGEQRPGVDRLDRLASRSQSLLAALGDDPMSMATLLGRLTATAVTAGAADALEQLRAQGAPLMANWEQRSGDPPASSPAAAELPETAS